MKLRYITDALTLLINHKYPRVKGFFIGKESIEATQINAYKTYKVEIYWHDSNNKNHLVFSQNFTDKCLEGKIDRFKESFSTVLLEQLFINLNRIENEVI